MPTCPVFAGLVTFVVMYYVAAAKKSKAERIEEKKAERRAKEAEKTMVVESIMKQ